jgi:hypothetical protein
MWVTACFHRRDAEDAEKEKSNHYKFHFRLEMTGQKARLLAALK